MSGPHHSPWARPPAHDQHAGRAPHRHPAPPQGWPPAATGPGPATQRNTLGIVAVGLAGLGILLACVPGIMPLGWVVLLIAFVLSLVAVTSTHKRTGVAIAGIGTSLGGVLVAAIAFVVATGVSPTSVLSDDEVVASSEAGGSTAAGGATGSREDPAAPGETVTVGDWEIVVNSFDRDATEQVMGTNRFNDPPPAGSEWALVDLTATYVGDELGSTTLIGVSYVTGEGTVIQWYDHVAVVPHALNGELHPGGTATTPQIGAA
ncbi:hypothetical protein [Dietzia kunjamensis]|uniref:hypothetical protein n=1 Tax=Dietzia kunjamensis TaxID=322509 RepID=UPI00336838BE